MVETLNEYQEEAHKTATYMERVESEYPNLPQKVKDLLALSYACNGLGEAGEIQNKFKKVIRDTPEGMSEDQIAEMRKELGDLMWYVAEIATLLGTTLQEVAQGNVNKLQSRSDRGAIHGSGDNR